MSVKVIAELHPARRDKTITHTEAGTVSEILSRLNAGFGEDHARVCLNGEIVRDFSAPAKDGDTLWVKFVFYGSGDTKATGATMKAGGSALAAIGVIVAAVTSWTGVGAFIGMALIGAGMGMLAGGIALFNMDIPSFKDREKPQSDPSIRGGRNQMRQHGRIPVLFGRHRLYPDLAATPYTEIEDNSQYFTQLFCGGYRDCVIDTATLKLGETLLTEFSQSKDIDVILAGEDPLIRMEILQDGGESSLYPRCVNEQMLNVPLEKYTDEGDSGAIVRTTPDNTDAINVDIFFYGGLGKYNSGGDLETASVEVAARYKRENDPDSAYELIGYFTGTGNTISGSELKTKRCQITKDGLAPGKYTVKVERVTDDSEDSKVTDSVYLGSIRSFKSSRPIRAERQRDLTIIALRLRASDRLSGAVDAFNYIAASSLPVYDNSGHTGPSHWLTTAQTGNPASMLLYALRGLPCQQPVDDSDIDYPSLERFFSWCEAHDYTCNAYLTESVTVSELFRMIGATSRAEILRLDSRVSVVQDITRDAPVQLFTPKNTIAYSETMMLADIPDEISLGFIDAERGYAENEAKVYNTPSGNRLAEPDTSQKINLWGVTDSKQARRIGMYNYACLKHRPFVHTIEADIEYLLCSKGDWIQYAGDIALAGTTQGRVTGVKTSSDGRCTGFYTDEPVEMASGSQYAVRLRKADGTVTLENVLFATGPRNEIAFASPPESGEAPETGDLYAFGKRGEETLDFIVTDIRPGADLAATLTCVEYSPVIFGVDQDDFILPDFINRVSEVSGAIDSGTVNPDNWRLFETYHDGEDEPAHPTGDGTAGGWHRGQTTASVWRSTKVAPSPESGVWSAAVRVRGEPGEPGAAASVYELVPGVTVIRRDTNGNPDPAAVTCAQRVISGGNPPQASDKTIKYVTSDTETETDYTAAVVVGAWSWIEFRLYDGDTLLDRERVPVLSDGPPATAYRLVPGVPLIVRNVSGVANPPEITCAQQVISGSNPPKPSDKTIKYVTSANQTETGYTGAIPVAFDWIEFRLYDGDTLLDRERVPVLSEGEPSKIYSLQPSASVIRVYDGGIADPYAISCLQVSVAGNGLPVLSDKTLKYATSSGDEKPCAGEITVNPGWAWIEFRLYDGDVLLDKERVPVLRDGVNQIRLDLPNQNIPVPCDSDGNPYSLPITTRAVLYNGNTPVTANDFYEKTVAAHDIVYYPGSGEDIFDPMPGGFYPVDTRWWFLSRNPLTTYEIARYPGSGDDVFDPALGDFYPIREDAGLIPRMQASIDQNGFITISQLTDDETTIIVSAKYGDAIYSTPLTLVKIKDAQRPVVIDIENENTSIACDVYGDPYPGELPLQTKAVLYWGTELVSPFWFLSAPAGGVSIAQDGTITVAQDAELAEANNVVIKAAFRGKTYTRMFTLTKARDGESPITLDLLPDNEVIQCDYLGNPLRGLPLTAKATLYRGTREITAAMELAEAARVEIIRYPGNIFDPAPGDFYPTLGYPVVWTLIGAPAGVTIDKYGLITAPLTAQLNDVNKITVRAAYHGRTYEAIFGITKARGGRPADPPAYLVYRYAKNTNPAAPPAYAANADNPGAGWSERPPSPGNGEHLWQLTSEWRGLIRLTGWTALCLNGEKGDAAVAARYRGATKTADTGNTGVVNIVGKPSSVMNPGDWVMFTGSSGWEYAYVYEWNGALWRQVPRGEMAYYLDGISDLTEGAPDGIFSAVFCRILFAQQAAINTLEAQLIRIGGAIFGGERFTRSGDSVVDNGANKTGFKIGADGLLEASGGIFNNILVTGNSEFRGKIISGPLYASNEDTAAKTHHVFEANTGIGSIWQALGPGKAAYYADGQYGGRTGITSLIFSRATGDIPGGGGAVGVYTMFIAFEDDAFDYLTDKITQRLDVYIHGDTGKTLRFIDLPVGGGSAIGDVYRLENGTLMVKTTLS